MFEYSSALRSVGMTWFFLLLFIHCMIFFYGIWARVMRIMMSNGRVFDYDFQNLFFLFGKLYIGLGRVGLGGRGGI